MTTIYTNVRGSVSGGGPSIFSYNITKEFSKRGFKVIYDNPTLSDIALCVIETGKVLKQVNRKKTRIVLRVNGIYNDEYNKLFNRALRPDMINLHNKLKHDIPLIDWVIYQSQWSRDRIEEEIVKRTLNWSIIHNGIDTTLFKPKYRNSDGFINVIHVGKMRDSYLMDSLIGTYKELKNKNINVKIILIGSMDAQCSLIYNQNKNDKNIQYLGSFANNKLHSIYTLGDIFVAPRQGSSNDHVVLEALACGLPVVVPSWGGNKELIEDGKEGIIVNSGHWDYGPDYIKKMADAVEKIIPDLDGFKKRARSHAEKNLTIEQMVDSYIRAMGI